MNQTGDYVCLVKTENSKKISSDGFVLTKIRSMQEIDDIELIFCILNDKDSSKKDYEIKLALLSEKISKDEYEALPMNYYDNPYNVIDTIIDKIQNEESYTFNYIERDKTLYMTDDMKNYYQIMIRKMMYQKMMGNRKKIVNQKMIVNLMMKQMIQDTYILCEIMKLRIVFQ